MPSLRLMPFALLFATALAGAAHAADASLSAPADPAPMFEAPPPSSRFT